MANTQAEENIWVQGVQRVTSRLGDYLADFGRVTILAFETITAVVQRRPSFRLVVDQMDKIGVGSMGLVIVVSLFTGAVAAIQASYQFSNVVPIKYLGSVILRSVIIELGPVLTALVVGGRVGAAIAAELGTMKVTEQIDAMRAMGISPLRFLVAPRVIASTIMLPVVTVFANTIAVFGGFVVAVLAIHVTPGTYINSIKDFFYMKDLMSGLIKAVVFGNIIGMMGCHYGFLTEGGAEGVGAATTRAVVSSCVLVLISDYLLASILFRVIFAE